MIVMLLQATSLHSAKQAAQICHRSINASASLTCAIALGHDSIKEHWVATFLIEEISRACSHQLVRHRMASYAQESQRHVVIDTTKEWYVTPPFIGEWFHQVMSEQAEAYNTALKMNISPEDARYILPNACKTSLVMTANARSLDNFFKLRTCKKAQWEIRMLAEEMLAICVKECPELFGSKNYPDCKNCKEKEECYGKTK